MCFKGQVKPDDVIGFIDRIVSDPEYNKEYDSIIDLRNTELHYDMHGLRKVLIYMATSEGFIGNRKSVYITSEANHVVPPIMMSSDQYKLPMQVKVCSSIDNAIEYLKVKNFDEDDYNDCISGMCNC